jgi:uncharacterized protein (DUF2384 family)
MTALAPTPCSWRPPATDRNRCIAVKRAQRVNGCKGSGEARCRSCFPRQVVARSSLTGEFIRDHKRCLKLFFPDRRRSGQRIKTQKNELSKLLDVDQSDRLWGMAEVLSKAEELMGSREEAEQWLIRPPLALDSRGPIDLMATRQGAELVKTLLNQLGHGVYV